MAWVLQTPQTATIRARINGTTDAMSVAGVTSGTTTVDNAITQLNKLVTISGKELVADATMTRTIKQEAINNE